MTTLPKDQGDQIHDDLKIKDKSPADASTNSLCLVGLPREVLLQVCLYLRPGDAAEFRATNKLFKEIASENTFEEIVIFHCDEDFAMLRHLADDPIYSKCIKSLTLDGNVLPVPPPLLEYKAARTAWEVRHCPYLSSSRVEPAYFIQLSRLLPESKLHDDHRRLTMHQHQQMQIFNNDTDYALFREVVPKLFNLKRVSVALQREFDLQWWEPTTPKPPFDHWHGMSSRCLPYNRARTVNSIMMALAISPSREKLRHLQLGAFHWEFIEQLNESALKLDQVVNICRNLTILEIAIRGEILGEDSNLGEDVDESEIHSCRRAISKRSLCKILAATPNLREVTLRFANRWQDMGARDPSAVNICFPAAIDNILPAEYHWRNLQKVELQTIECAPQQLLSLLERHASTLKSAMFRHVRLVNESWLIFLPQVRELMSRATKTSPPAPGLLGIVCFAGLLYGTSMQAPYLTERWDTDEELSDTPEDGRLAYRIMLFINSAVDLMPLGPANSIVDESDHDGELSRKIDQAFDERHRQELEQSPEYL